MTSLDGVAAAQRQRFVDDGFQRQVLAAAQLLVGGDHGHRAGVDDALLQRLGREAAEHHRVGRADARAGLHRGHAFDRHRHVDDDAVALLDAARLQAVGELADALVQFLVGGARDRAVVGFEDDRGLVGVAVLEVAVEAVVRRVQLAVVEPFVERRVGLVERAGERLVPVEVLARQARPEAFVIGGRFGAQLFVGRHAGNGGVGDELRPAARTRGFPASPGFPAGLVSVPAMIVSLVIFLSTLALSLTEPLHSGRLQPSCWSILPTFCAGHCAYRQAAVTRVK